MTAPVSTLERHTTPTGDTVYVDHDNTEPGGLDPFHPFYADPDGETRLGFVCGNCGAIDATMDTMGRIECGGCGNARLPTRNDAGYL